MSTVFQLPTFSFRPHKKRSPWFSCGGKMKIGRRILVNYKSTIIYWYIYIYIYIIVEVRRNLIRVSILCHMS